MLHPALARALATAHIEDLRRAAAQSSTIRFARRVAHEPHVAATPIAMLRSAPTRLRGRPVPQAENSPLRPEVLDTGVEDKSLKLDGTTLSWVRSDGEPRSATVP